MKKKPKKTCERREEGGMNNLWYYLKHVFPTHGPQDCTVRPATRYVNCLQSFINLVVCLMTGPTPLPKRALHTVRSRASFFKWDYPLLSWRPSSSFLRLLPRLPVTSIPLPPFIFPSITCCRKQFLHKMWPIQLAFRLLISCFIFLYSLTRCNTSSFLIWSVL
jgi:hypothetical protein